MVLKVIPSFVPIPRLRDGTSEGEDPPSLKLRRMKGEMAEWSNAAVLKTVMLYPRHRGFESLFLRQSHQTSPAAFAAGFLFYEKTEPGLPERGLLIKQKPLGERTGLMALKLSREGS